MAVGRIGEYRLGTNASWDEYVERLEMFCEANQITKEEQKRAVLLSSCGEEVYGLIVTLVKPERPTAATYEEIKTAVRKHMHPKPSELYARFLFYRRNQAAEESVADYVTALRKLAEDCGFGSAQLPLDVMIEGVQQRLLAEHSLTFKVAYDLATTAEATAKQQRDIRKHGRYETDCQEMQVNVEDVPSRFPEVFRRDLPGFNGPPVHIELKDDAQPVFLKSRPVPLALKDDVANEVDRLVQQGVWEPVSYSNWATPLVVPGSHSRCLLAQKQPLGRVQAKPPKYRSSREDQRVFDGLSCVMALMAS
ncbi:uncharacterized protein LOC144095670 [Amblyomma americanum]